VTLSDNFPFLVLEQPCDVAVDWLVGQVSRAGLSVRRTFDLQVARHDQAECPCPHHRTDQCDCQMVVLMIYQLERHPIVVTAHGYNGQTWFSVVDTPQQRADPHLESMIRRLVAPLLLDSIKLESKANAD